jgi:hypothetical protein
MNFSGITLPGADFEQEKEKIKDKDGFYEHGVYRWPGAPLYGDEMLSLGIKEGERIYKELTMPGITFNVTQLIAAVKSAMARPIG